MLSAGNQGSRDPPQRGRLYDIPGMVKVDVSIAGMSCLEGSIPYLSRIYINMKFKKTIAVSYGAYLILRK